MRSTLSLVTTVALTLGVMALHPGVGAAVEEASAGGSETPPAQATGAAEPEPLSEAVERAREAARHLESLETFGLEATTIFDVVQDAGQKLQFSDRRVLTIRRPDRAYAAFRDDHGSSQYLYYDGETLTRYDRDENVYGVLDVPDTLDATLDYLELELGAPLPLADLFYSNLSHVGLAASQSDWVGAAFVAGALCDHLAFRNDDLDWQIWIEQGDVPWLRKLVITYKTLPGEPQFSAYFTSWHPEPAAEDETFVFRAPAGAQRITTLALPTRGKQEPVELEGEAR